MITLSAPPSLLPLFAKAALTAPLHRGDALPDSRYRLDGQAIDAKQLADYDRVCGFRYSDVLPATYLHVLAFPLSIALMSEQAFPFPLIGLVHIANSITVHRPVTVDETVSFEVSAADLRPHRAGRQFELRTAARVGEELVWAGRSTYLRRGGSPDSAGKTRKPRAAAPEPSGALTQLRVPGDIGRRYAAVSGDRNPIHLSGLSAKAFGFPSAIAHGMWLSARTLATLEGRLPPAYSVEVAFKTPVLLPSTVAIAADRRDTGWMLDVRGVRTGKPHLTGTVSGASG